jgi:CheY-like chemotaxis protein
LARKILLADDSVTAQNMGRKILADAGYDVVTVNNGSAALKRITEVKPDLIVLDVYMPGYSGLEVCQRLKDAQETAHIPVLLTVGKLEPFKPEEARRVRADAHIVKPFEASELLTAITRLEDRMVPQQSDGARFSTSVSGVERFGGEGRKTESEGETDTSWKSRLRFPSKKRKEEPEPEPDESGVGATFRDFRKGKGKTGASAPFTVKAPAPPGQEPGLVPDIPRDITPDELDALSALAAKLDGPIPAAENITPLAEKMGPATPPVFEVAPLKTEEVKTEAEVPAVVAEAKTEAAAEAQPEPKIEAKEDVEMAAAVVESVAETVAAAVVEGASAVEIPVERAEPAAVVAEVPALVAVVPVNTATLVEEAAPVDRTDEPVFAAAASAVEQAPEEKVAESKVEEEPVEAVAKTEVTEAVAPVEAVAAKDLESKAEASEAYYQGEDSKAETTEQPAPGAASAAKPEAEEPAPSDEELAEALRLLTPATGHTDGSTIPSHGTLVAAGQLLAEEAARNAMAAPRWIAEPVALSAEEVAISLEAEMFRTFATTPAAVPGGGMDAVGVAGVSAIAAAVENRLASLEQAAGAKSLSEQNPVEPASENTRAETVTAETPALVTPVVSKVEVAAVQEPVAPEKTEDIKIEAGQNDSRAKVVEEAVVEETASATFADAMSQGEVEETARQKTEAVREPAEAATTAVAEENQDSSPEAGSEESMGKDGKAKWHQIHKAPAGAAANSNVVEAAKQAEPAAEEAPKAMAAAAAEGSSSGSATDAGTIASIVDSVMADLRPKIVEEIAKKLAGR